MPLHVEDVLRPSVDAARHAAEAVLQRQRDADPVMRLQLRHRDDDVGVMQHLRNPELAEARCTAFGEVFERPAQH